MLSERAAHTLTAAVQCIGACRLLSNIRPTIKTYVTCYEPCVDKALAQSLVLLFALMTEHSSCVDEDAMPALELGMAPCTPSEAIATLGDFLTLAEYEIRRSLSTQMPSPDAMSIAQRALTYAGLLDEEVEA